MKWRREINYHGHRLYEPGPDPKAGLWNRLKTWTRLQSARLFKGVLQSSDPNPLNEDDFYSLLGTGRKNNAAARAKAACPFPLHGSDHRRTIRSRSHAHDS